MAGIPLQPISRRRLMTTTATKKTRASKGKMPKTTDKRVDISKPKKASALDSAAKVLEESNAPMTCKEMIEAMTAKGYWTSAEGKTPANTLYSAILREIKIKGVGARFKKADRGKFARA
jgi:hypothetical protein